jgi:hypothetical protein
MSTDTLIVVTNAGLILVSLAGMVATILANDKLAEVARAAIARLVSGSSASEHGKHEK